MAGTSGGGGGVLGKAALAGGGGGGRPTALHLCGLPTGIFVSLVLRQKGTYGLIGH